MSNPIQQQASAASLELSNAMLLGPVSNGPVSNNFTSAFANLFNQASSASTYAPAQVSGGYRPSGAQRIAQISAANGQQFLGAQSAVNTQDARGFSEGLADAFGFVLEFLREIVVSTIRSTLESLGLTPQAASRPTAQSAQAVSVAPQATGTGWGSYIELAKQALPLVKQAGPIAKDVLLDLGKGFGGAIQSIGTGIGAGVSAILTGIGSIFTSE